MSEPAQGKAAGGRDNASVMSASAQVHRTSKAMRRRFNETAGVAQDWAVDRFDGLRDTIRTKPLMAVGVAAACAFAVGLCLGAAIGRR